MFALEKIEKRLNSENQAQVRIAEIENTSQYWTSLGSQKSANVTGPISTFFKSAQYLSTGTVHWHFKFVKLPPKLGLEMALYWAESWYYSAARYTVVRNLPVYWQPVTGKYHFGNDPVLVPSLGNIFASTAPTLGRF